MIYLLDTNVCIHLLNEKHSAILQHFRQHGPTDIAICSVVKAELLYGARRSQRVETNLQLCPAAKLVGDGSQHFETGHQAKDQARDAALAGLACWCCGLIIGRCCWKRMRFWQR